MLQNILTLAQPTPNLPLLLPAACELYRARYTLLNKMEKKRPTLTIIVVLSITILILGRIDWSKNCDKLLENCDYSIGCVTVLTSTPKFPSAKYKNTVLNKEYNSAIFSSFYRMPENVNEGEKFLVAYDKLDYYKRLILFKYPIKDSSDFIKYIKELNNNKAKLYKNDEK